MRRYDRQKSKGIHGTYRDIGNGWKWNKLDEEKSSSLGNFLGHFLCRFVVEDLILKALEVVATLKESAADVLEQAPA